MPVEDGPALYQAPKRRKQSDAGQSQEQAQNVVKKEWPGSRRGSSLKGKFLGARKLRLLRRLRF